MSTNNLPGPDMTGPAGTGDYFNGYTVATVRRIVAQRDEQIAALRATNAELLEALKALLRRDERNTCRHESTHRGGVLWTICDQCGRKWADDEGGMPDWSDPPEWDAAYAAIAKATGEAA